MMIRHGVITSGRFTEVGRSPMKLVRVYRGHSQVEQKPLNRLPNVK